MILSIDLDLDLGVVCNSFKNYFPLKIIVDPLKERGWTFSLRVWLLRIDCLEGVRGLGVVVHFGSEGLSSSICGFTFLPPSNPFPHRYFNKHPSQNTLCSLLPKTILSVIQSSFKSDHNRYWDPFFWVLSDLLLPPPDLQLHTIWATYLTFFSVKMSSLLVV